MFWATLYHPNELRQVHSIINRFLRRQQEQPDAVIIPRFVSPDKSFNGFFCRGCIGSTLFHSIRQYLDIYDLLANFSTAGITNGANISGLFTFSNLLDERGAPILRQDRFRVGIETAKHKSKYRGSNEINRKHRPYRVVDGFGDRSHLDYLYHPEEKHDVCEYIDWCLKVIEKRETVALPVGVRTMNRIGSFCSAQFSSLDVTLKVATLAQKNAGILNLTVPMTTTRDGRGGTARRPQTFFYWYMRYFGDPNPRKTKYLELTFFDSTENEFYVVKFEEQTVLNLFIGT